MGVSKSKTIRIATIAFIGISVLGLGIFGYRVVTQPDATDDTSPTSFQLDKTPQEVADMSATLKDASSKTIGLTFALSAEGVPTTLASQTIFTTRPDRQQLEPQQYTLQIGSQDDENYTTNFSVPTAAISESFSDNGDISLDHIASPSSYSIIVPWFPDGTTLTIKDAKGAVVLESALKSVEAQ